MKRQDFTDGTSRCFRCRMICLRKGKIVSWLNKFSLKRKNIFVAVWLSLKKKNVSAAVWFVFKIEKCLRCGMICPKLCEILLYHVYVLYSRAGVAKLFWQSANSSTNPCRMRHKCRAGVANLFSPCAKIFRHTSIHLKMRHTNIHSFSLLSNVLV